MPAKFNLIVIMGIIMLLILPIQTVYSASPDTIYIVTPEWEDQTEEDGSGLFFDIIRQIYEPVGVKLKFEIMPWARAEKMVNLNQADAIPAEYKDDKALFPTYPLYVDYTAAVFKKDRISEWKGLQTMRGRSALWIRGYNFHEVRELTPLDLKWTEIDDYAQAWNMLAHNRVDFYIESLIDLEKYIAAHKIDIEIYQVEIIVSRNAYLKFSNSDKSKKLIEIYNQRFPELLASGTIEALFKQYNVKFEPFDPAND